MWVDIVQSWLEENDRSQAELARMAGISIFHLNRCMVGKAMASRRLLYKLQNAMNENRRHGTPRISLVEAVSA